MPVAAPRHGFTKRKAWANPHATKRLITGRALQREREALFAEQPLCVECLKGGLAIKATIRDHKTPLAFGGLDERENTQPLCQPCSDAKTKAEGQDGARAARQ